MARKTRRNKTGRRGRARRSAKKSASRKRLVRLIHAVALKDAETKKFREGFSPFAWRPSLGSWNMSYGFNIFANIPKIKNTATDTSTSLIGEDFQARGVSLKFVWSYVGAASTLYPVSIRITLVSTSNATDLDYPGVFSSGSLSKIPSGWQEGTTGLVPTFARWNTQRLRVLKTRTMYWTPGGGNGFHKSFKFWCPVKGHKKLYTNESTTFNDYVGILNGKNYYCLVEMLNSQGLDVQQGATLYCDRVVYFKDP